MNNTCKICGNKTEEFYDEQMKSYYYYCSNCEFISKAEESILSITEEKNRYNYHNNSIDDIKYVNYFKKFLDTSVLKYVKGKDGLDFGSGPSPVLSMILEKDYNFKMDIYDLFYAPKKVYIGKKYDLITCTEVIEHLKYPMKYFNLFKNLLNKYGILAIMTSFHPKSVEDFHKWYYKKDSTHISFFTENTMKIISKKTGLNLLFTDNKKYSIFNVR
ncbi:methyltransferase [Tepiditoga spiralis]|uniref:Methyltransferase n=1 Tax=Tepiditoga spiralis TaxID=2108365 RepID=A0A7G1G900_9BACT|nr:class I SAM-dependent methyltransferase [Tepiditoga spiralis]BBE30542.1 methyltransferase [Tepiditoga spiralis]